MDKEFLTGLFPLDTEIKPKPPYNGAGWTARLKKRQSRGGRREVLIKARSWVTAQRALSLILAGCYLLSGEPPSLAEDELVVHNETEPQNLDETERIIIKRRGFGTFGVPLACAVAAKASRKKEFAYALSKYKFSISLFKSHNVDLDPHHALGELSISQFHYHHILFSHCIISAYSVLEELGLEIKATTDNPSKIDSKWNPNVKNDLEKRLINSGVDLSEKLLWIRRGTPKKIELTKTPEIKSKMWWSSGNVRDAEIEIIDAISYASWLRSKVSSHKINKLTSSLSPYDVENIQHLARRLLLESLGYWRYL